MNQRQFFSGSIRSSHVSVTLNVYTHVLDDIKEKTISKLNNLYLTSF